MVKPRRLATKAGRRVQPPPTMPTANSDLHARALARAQAHESVELLWESGTGTVAFRATLNRLVPESGAVDRNDGDDTACTLTAVVSAGAAKALRPGNLPGQGDTFTGEAGATYRVARCDYAPRLPKIVFHIPHVAAAA